MIAVPRLGSERKEVLSLAGISTPEIPILVDGKTVVQGSDEIIAYLQRSTGTERFGDPSYGLTRTLTGFSFADAIGSVKEALLTEGFGVLTEIDVKATLKKKIDVDFRNYVILGACNPKLAYESLTAEPALGLLLPCNVVVTEESDGKVAVSAIDPVKMFKILDNDAIENTAQEVRKKLSLALSRIVAK